MTILELNQFDELNDFGTDWNQLLSKSLDNHPFLTSQWLTSWWKHFGKEKELKLFAAKSEGKPSIVIPVMYSTCRAFGSKRRKVSFVAAPDSDYQVFLVTNLQEASRTVNQLIGTIMEDSAADCVVFGEVPEDSVTAKLLKDANVNGSGVSSSVINSCPYIPLPNNTDIFLQNLGSNMRRNLKVGEKQASKDFQVKFVKYDEIGTVEEAMNILFDLHQKREIAIGNFGVFSNDANRSFHMQVAKSFAEKGWLSLFFLTFNDKPVSTIYSFEYNEKLYGYLCGFDPEYTKYRPGHLAFKNIIQYGIKKNLKEFDFLRGDEEYKSRWRALSRNNFEFRFPNRGLKSKFYNWTMNHKSFSHFNGVSALSQRLRGKESS